MSDQNEVYYLGSLQIQDHLHQTGFRVRFQIWHGWGSRISNHGSINLDIKHIYAASDLMRQRIICERFTETGHLIEPLWELMQKAGEI